MPVTYALGESGQNAKVLWGAKVDDGVHAVNARIVSRRRQVVKLRGALDEALKSLRHEPTVGLVDAFGQINSVFPPERMQLRHVEKLARRPIGLGNVPSDRGGRIDSQS